MKKLLVLLVLTVSANVFAQSSEKDDVAMIQSAYGKTKTELVNEYMALSAADKAAFQPIYDSYESERKALGRKKFDIIKDYADSYSTLTDAKADQLINAVMDNNMQMEKLYDKTYKKAKKAIGALNAAKFIQLEVYFQTSVRGEIQDSIPFIGELEKSKH